MKKKPFCRSLLLMALACWRWTAVAQTYTEAYTFSTFAGLAASGSADGVGTQAQFNFPVGLVVDSSGNTFVADSYNHTIRKITPAGVVTTFAGVAGYYGADDGTGEAARFYYPTGIAMDNAGNFYVADQYNGEIRKITPAGVVTTIAGNTGIFGTNDGVGSAAQFFFPGSIAVDSQTNLFVDDVGNHTIRKITPAGVVSTYAGQPGQMGTNDGPALSARFGGNTISSGIAVDGSGNVFVADTGNFTIRKITPAGVVSTFAGIPGVILPIQGQNATNFSFQYPGGVATDKFGNVYVADSGDEMIRKLSPSGLMVTNLAGNGIGVADGTGASARFNFPSGIALDSTGKIYVSDTANNAIRKMTQTGSVTTIAGAGTTSGGGTDGTADTARFHGPLGAVASPNGEIYVADTDNHVIREISPAGVVSTLAGLDSAPGTNDGIGTDANFNNPHGIAADSSGNLYVADAGNGTIRMVTPDGIVTTIAGRPGVFGTNDGLAHLATFGGSAGANGLGGLAVDGASNIYVVECNSETVRKITPQGFVTTIAGVPFSSGTNDGPKGVSQFQFGFNAGVTVDAATNLYIADTYNHTIRKITPAGMTSTFAGQIGVFGADDGLASTATFVAPNGITADSSGNLYVSDGYTIRKLEFNGSVWTISTLGGSPVYGTGSADGVGMNARFSDLSFPTVDSFGTLYIADSINNTIRKGVFTQFGAAAFSQVSASPQTGSLQVTLLPPEVGGQWRFPWEVGWHNSGDVAGNLSPGGYPVEFRSIPGYLAVPAALTTSNAVVITAGVTTSITNNYYPTIAPTDTNSAAGLLGVFLGANPPAGAGWRFLGDTTPYFPSGFTTNLLPGTYLIEFAGPFTNRATPPNASVQVFSGQPSFISVSYAFAAPPPAAVLTPVPVQSGLISDVTDYPYGFNGQLQSDVGYGSGVAVQSNVVLTCAHLDFNDETLGYVSGAYWFLQQEKPYYTPSPLTARGWVRPQRLCHATEQ